MLVPQHCTDLIHICTVIAACINRYLSSSVFWMSTYYCTIRLLVYCCSIILLVHRFGRHFRCISIMQEDEKKSSRRSVLAVFVIYILFCDTYCICFTGFRKHEVSPVLDTDILTYVCYLQDILFVPGDSHSDYDIAKSNRYPFRFSMS